MATAPRIFDHASVHTDCVWQRRLGWALSGLFGAFMAFDVAIKLVQLPVVGDTLKALGWPPEFGFPIGFMELLAVVLYFYRRTSILGAVLMTGILGGAVASHVRIGSPLFSHVLFGIYLGLFMWGGLWLRDPSVRQMLPVRRLSRGEGLKHAVRDPVLR
jgi:hypothetical protein